MLQEFSRSTRVKVSLTPNRFATYFGIAFFTTIIPSYLFHSVRGLDFEGFTVLLYVIVCAGAAYLLSQAYHNMYARTFARLKKINDKDFVLKAGTEPEEKQRLENAKDVLTQQSALGQALAITNVVYLAVSLLFSFYVLSSADVRVYVELKRKGCRNDD